MWNNPAGTPAKDDTTDLPIDVRTLSLTLAGYVMTAAAFLPLFAGRPTDQEPVMLGGVVLQAVHWLWFWMLNAFACWALALVSGFPANRPKGWLAVLVRVGVALGTAATAMLAVVMTLLFTALGTSDYEPTGETSASGCQLVVEDDGWGGGQLLLKEPGKLQLTSTGASWGGGDWGSKIVTVTWHGDSASWDVVGGSAEELWVSDAGEIGCPG